MKVINEAADKFKDKQAEVFEALLDLLRLINEQESSMFEKDCEIRGRSKELSAEEEKNERDLMWENYRSNVKNIVDGRCTARLIRRGYASSFSIPRERSVFCIRLQWCRAAASGLPIHSLLVRARKYSVRKLIYKRR